MWDYQFVIPQDWKTFEREWADMIVDSINHLRTAAGLTIKDMAARLRDGGWPVSEATLSGILSGRKRGALTISEVLTFAWALDVPPTYLMAGFPRREQAPASPMWPGGATGADVAAWISGDSDQIARHEGAAPEGVKRAFGGDALANAKSHTVLLRRVRSLAAELTSAPTAVDQFDEAYAVQFKAEDVHRILRSNLARLAQIRAQERMIDPSWKIHLGPLPEALSYLDTLSILDSHRSDSIRDLTAHELASLVTPADISSAESIKATARETAAILLKEAEVAPPADTDQ